eukprot:scpid108434/ scgid15725/ 
MSHLTRRWSNTKSSKQGIAESNVATASATLNDMVLPFIDLMFSKALSRLECTNQPTVFQVGSWMFKSGGVTAITHLSMTRTHDKEVCESASLTIPWPGSP